MTRTGMSCGVSRQSANPNPNPSSDAKPKPKPKPKPKSKPRLKPKPNHRYLNLPAVRTALHVRPQAGVWTPCSQTLNDAYSCSDTLVNVAPLYHKLLADTPKPRRLLVYSGDVDGVVPTLASKRWVDSMPGKTLIRDWAPWRAGDGQIGGWGMGWRVGKGALVFATVRGAGHQVPAYQPARASQLFQSFLHAGELPPGDV